MCQWGAKNIWTTSHFQLAKNRSGGFYAALLSSLFSVRVLELCLKASDLEKQVVRTEISWLDRKWYFDTVHTVHISSEQ